MGGKEGAFFEYWDAPQQHYWSRGPDLSSPALLPGVLENRNPHYVCFFFCFKMHIFFVCEVMKRTLILMLYILNRSFVYVLSGAHRCHGAVLQGYAICSVCQCASEAVTHLKLGSRLATVPVVED